MNTLFNYLLGCYCFYGVCGLFAYHEHVDQDVFNLPDLRGWIEDRLADLRREDRAPTPSPDDNAYLLHAMDVASET